MNITDALEMIERGETPEQYEKRIKRLRRLCNERDDLIDSIQVLADDERSRKRKERLQKVLCEIERIK